jgi:hypothetical protein
MSELINHITDSTVSSTEESAQKSLDKSVKNCILLLNIAAGGEDLKQQMYERLSSKSAFKNVVHVIEREAENSDTASTIIMASLYKLGEEEITAVSWPYLWMLYDEWDPDTDDDEEAAEWERIKKAVEHYVLMRSARDTD